MGKFIEFMKLLDKSLQISWGDKEIHNHYEDNRKVVIVRSDDVLPQKQIATKTGHLIEVEERRLIDGKKDV